MAKVSGREGYEEYDSLVRPIEGRMMRSVWRLAPDPDDAADVFQDASMKILRQWRKVRAHPNPQALVLRICVNAAYDFLRRKARRGKKR